MTTIIPTLAEPAIPAALVATLTAVSAVILARPTEATLTAEAALIPTPTVEAAFVTPVEACSAAVVVQAPRVVEPTVATTVIATIPPVAAALIIAPTTLSSVIISPTSGPTVGAPLHTVVATGVTAFAPAPGETTVGTTLPRRLAAPATPTRTALTVTGTTRLSTTSLGPA